MNGEQTNKSWKPAVKIAGEEDHWSYNALRFPTKDEAFDNARALAGRWFVVVAYDAHPSDDPPNYNWVDGQLSPIQPKGGD